MAGSKSDAMEDIVLDSILGKSSTSLSTANSGINPSTLWVGLWNSTLNNASTPATDGQCAGSTYARVNVNNSSTVWTNASAGSKNNKFVIEFTTSAGSDWGTIKAFGIMTQNSTTAGSLLYWGDLTSQQVISSGNVVRFSTGAIVVTED